MIQQSNRKRTQVLRKQESEQKKSKTSQLSLTSKRYPYKSRCLKKTDSGASGITDTKRGISPLCSSCIFMIDKRKRVSPVILLFFSSSRKETGRSHSSSTSSALRRLLSSRTCNVLTVFSKQKFRRNCTHIGRLIRYTMRLAQLNATVKRLYRLKPLFKCTAKQRESLGLFQLMLKSQNCTSGTPQSYHQQIQPWSHSVSSRPQALSSCHQPSSSSSVQLLAP